MRGLFGKIWRRIRGNLGSIIGGAIGGPIGGLIGHLIHDMIEPDRGIYGIDTNLSPAAERSIETWSTKFFEPFITNSIEWVGADRNIIETSFIEKYNQILLQIRSWQAYYEAIYNNPRTGVLDREIAEGKYILLSQAVLMFKEAYEGASAEQPSEMFFENRSYNPVTITEVGGDKLEWEKIGVKTITANNSFLTNGEEIPQTEFAKAVLLPSLQSKDQLANKMQVEDEKRKEEQRIADLEKQRVERLREEESEAKRQAELETKKQAELEAKRQAELEAKKQAELEAQRQAEFEKNNITPPKIDDNPLPNAPSLPNISPNIDTEETTGTKSNGKKWIIAAVATAVLFKIFN